MSDRDENTKESDAYRSLLQAELDFSRATGYDREQTAVVPLAELARREEERLRRLEQNKNKPSPAQKPALPISQIIEVLRVARSVEEVAGVLVETLSSHLPRILLFWERNGTLYGFASRGMGLSEVKLLTIELPLPLMEEICGCSLEFDSFRGKPQVNERTGRFFDIIGGRPAEILLVTAWVTVQDRWVLYADALGGEFPAFEQRMVEVVVSRASARADLMLDGKAF
jgi:hypothetical protein